MKTTLVLSIILSLSTLTGCGSSKNWNARLQPETNSTSSSGPAAFSGITVPAIDLPDFVISYETGYKIRTKHADSVHTRVEQIARKYGGVVLEATADRTRIRVLAEHQEEAENDVEQLGEVTDRRMIGRDLTDTQYDVESRLAQALKVREKYLEQLERADSPVQVMSLEKEIERLNGVIDSLRGKINKLDRVVRYAGITVDTYRGVKPGHLVAAAGWVFNQAKSLFVR